MKKFFAFTLAEVLITLSIVGIVAALTMPTLKNNVSTKAFSTASQIFEQEIEESLKVMNFKKILAGYSTTEDFARAWQRYLKVNKVCSKDKLAECFPSKFYWGGGTGTPEEIDLNIIKTAKNFGQKEWKTNVMGFQLTNGMSLLFAYNPECVQDPFSNKIVATDCIAMLYDTNSFANPNTSGKDLGSNKNIKSLGSICAFKINDICYSAPFIPTPRVWNACNSEGETTDPDDLAFMTEYGLAYCMTPNFGTDDYWAGAVKECGGKDKLPSAEQLGLLADYVYNTSGIGTSKNVSNLVLDTDKVSLLGFTLSSSNYFYVWSRVEDSYDGAYDRSFGPTDTQWYGSYIRVGDHVQAICIE